MFNYPSLLWIGLPLVALPVLIHLINMLRHRRVKWAAMDFLLQSQKRHKNWIIFKQLLLLLLRMAAIAAVALMVAQPIVRSEWGDLFGSAKTHHNVLLDDSYSMSDRWMDTSAFAEAKQVVQRLVDRAVREGSSQTFSLLRFSEAGRQTPGSQPTMLEEAVNADLAIRLENVLGRMRPSQTAAGPAEALDGLLRQPSQAKDETQIIYLVSDFRTPQWHDATPLRASLEKLNQRDARIHLVQCVDDVRDNLAVIRLGPQSGVRAAGVEMLMEVGVHNFGFSTTRQVPVELTEDGFSRPGLVIDAIAPGETIVRQFRVNFDTAGHHTVTASVGSDALGIDNRRYFSVKTPETIPLLLIDGSSTARDAYFLATALAPGGKIKTGWKPRIETPQFLRDVEQLDRFAAVFLLNTERLGEMEIQLLENYVRQGGGVAFFLGERSRAEFFNERLYRNGDGLFPLPLTRPTELLVSRLEKTPDLTVTDHPIYSILAGERNSFIHMVQVDRYFDVPAGWSPATDSGVQVVARLRNNAPFALVKSYGDGRVFVQLSKVSPEETRLGRWNNWATGNPTFPVVMNELAGYLSQTYDVLRERMVGEPLIVEVDPSVYRPQTRFHVPRKRGMEAEMLDVMASAGPEGVQAKLAETPESGFYEVFLSDTQGQEERRVFSYNVDLREGDLQSLDSAELAAGLSGIRYEYHRARDLQFDPQELAGFNLSDTLLYLLVAVLLAEQLLAFSASYHPPRLRTSTEGRR